MLDSSNLSKDCFNSGNKKQSEDYPTYKILIIGDKDVGKTSLIYRYINNEFNEKNDTSIGLDFQEKTVKVTPKKKITLMIWDTAGSEKFRSIAHSFFTNCDGIILCYDTTDKKTFENLNGWINYINEYIEIKIDTSNENIKNNEGEDEEENDVEELEWAKEEQFKPVVVLAGTKADLEDNKCVFNEDIKNLTKIIKCEYFETSAKSGVGVEDVFLYMAKDLFEKKIAIAKKRKGFKLKNDRDINDSQCKSNATCC
jgi:GTPase SAR1 family protein